MTPGLISKRVVLDRLAWIDSMVAEIRQLPLSDSSTFLADKMNYSMYVIPN